MNVLHINEHLARKGGVETYLWSLLSILRERGVKLQVAYGAGDPATLEDTFHVPGISRTGFRSQGAVREHMQDILNLARPDVIHVHNVKNVGVLQACHAYGSTLLTTHDYRLICPASMFFYRRTQEVCSRQCGLGCFTTTLKKRCLTPNPRYSSYYYYRARWFLGQARDSVHMIAPSKGARDRLVHAGCDEQRITVLPYFCPLQPVIKPRPLPKTTTITFMGRIAPNKGQEYFIQALGQLPESVQGIMVGSFTNISEQFISQLAREHKCHDRLVLRRWASRAEVLEILDNTTVFVFPSLWPETLGIVGLEALSRGVPVVASDIGGVREWLEDGKNGILVQPKSAEQIRDAILFLTSDEKTLFDFGENGIKTINSRFLPSQHADELVRLYRRIADRH